MRTTRKKKTSAMGIVKKILNVGILACILSIVLYMTQVHVPSVIEDTVDYLGSLAAPLSMIIIGDSITNIKIKELLSDWKLLLFFRCKPACRTGCRRPAFKDVRHNRRAAWRVYDYVSNAGWFDECYACTAIWRR